MAKSAITHQSSFTLSIAALGVVFGDIGTSPLYAIRASLEGIKIDLIDVLGVLSLITWALVLVISVKYLTLIFRADNEGEGGILALLALLKSSKTKAFGLLFVVGIFGGGLLLGDGMLTPAISVTSAVEGLTSISPALTPWVLPLTVVILIALFSFQAWGTAKIGFLFGPVILIWFSTIAILGLLQIIQNPIVLKAINPYYAYEFFHINGWRAYTLLGGVFLVITGGEALYADMGHFGKAPIRLGWYLIVLPGLLLNYFGQGAHLLSQPAAISNPFYSLAPPGFSLPLLIIATLATVIASQAIISATFSLTKQAILLGLYPHMPIIQTSAHERGQIYIPQINFIIAIGTLLFVLTFKHSNSLAHAYGIAVNLDMVLITLMIISAAHSIWKWSLLTIALVFSSILLIDLMFLGANIQKVLTGGWIPLVFAGLCAFVMYTWHTGIEYLRKNYYMKKEDLAQILKQLHYKNIKQLPNTTIFITDLYDKSGGSFLHFLKLNHAIPEKVLILDYLVENIPYVKLANRFHASCWDKNICQITLHYGFMDFIDIPQALNIAREKQLLPFLVNPDEATYMVEIPNVLATRNKRSGMFFQQEKLFSFLMRNYSVNLNIEFYKLPFNRTIAIGTYFII